MKDQDHLLAVIEALRGEVRSLGARVGELEARLADAAQPSPATTTTQAV